MFENPRKNLVYVIILIIPFLLFFVRADNFSSFRLGIVQFFKIPIKIVSYPLYEVKKILYYHRTFNEYKRLRKEVDTLRSRIVGMDELMEENARLADLLNFKLKLIYSSTAANVIGRNPSMWNSSFIIDKGKEDNIQEGMPVVSALGVIGKIAEVQKNTSKVILLTDPQFSVAALVQNPREAGLITGTLQGVCRLKFLNENARIQVGDKVITSKLSSSFPEGLLIGEIIKVQDDPKSQTIEGIVVPAVSLSQIEEVLVILKQ